MIWFKKTKTGAAEQTERAAASHDSPAQGDSEEPGPLAPPLFEGEAPAPPREMEEVMTVLATELCSAWRENAVAAEDRWGGRTLYIGGCVERVVRRSHDTLGLMLENGGRLTAIVCEFPEQLRGELVGLRAGTAVVVRGTVRDSQTFEFRVVDCAVEATESAPSETGL